MADRVGWTEEGFTNRVPWVWPLVKPEWDGQPWCAAAVTAAFLAQGVDLRPLCQDNNSFYVPNLESMARKHGVWVQDSGLGRIVVYGNSYGVHTGISKPANIGSGYWAFEGNTSPSDKGSQANGGGLYYRGRARSWIRGWIDMTALIDQLGLGPQLVPAIDTPPAVQPAAPSVPPPSQEDTMYVLKSPNRFLVVDPVRARINDLGGASAETKAQCTLHVQLDGNDRQCDLNAQLLLDCGYARS